MLPEDVQALLGGILFFFIMSFLFAVQKIKAEQGPITFSTSSVEVVRFQE